MLNSRHLISLSISLSDYPDFVNQIIKLAISQLSSYVCVANVHMLVEAYQNQEFSQVVNEADIVTPDGVPLTWGLNLLHKIKQDRVAGMDLLPDLLEKAFEHNISTYFYGGTQEMLNKTKEYIKQFHPALKVAGMYSPPFRNLTLAEEEDIITNINSSGANLVFVALGCPKQEKWMASMKGKINACMVGIGGALPVLIGIQKRAPKWMQTIGLEWLYRLCQEPQRLFKRYAVTNSIFLYLLFKEFIQIKLTKRI